MKDQQKRPIHILHTRTPNCELYMHSTHSFTVNVFCVYEFDGLLPSQASSLHCRCLINVDDIYRNVDNVIVLCEMNKTDNNHSKHGIFFRHHILFHCGTLLRWEQFPHVCRSYPYIIIQIDSSMFISCCNSSLTVVAAVTAADDDGAGAGSYLLPFR